MKEKTSPNSQAFGFASDHIFYKGLTKREYFAVAAMQGLLTRVPKRDNGQVDLGVLESKRIVEESVIIADELIEQLNKED